jgi:SAM-dependent methyltransferase
MSSINLAMRSLPKERCPACGIKGATRFYELKDVPVDGATVFDDSLSAVSSACGDISLCLCDNCEFIFNRAFSEKVFGDQGSYQDQQGFSPAFQKYAEQLADRLIERYKLRGKTVVEIGCGKGDFLRLMVERGNNKGIGIDPKSSSTAVSQDDDRLSFLSELYSVEHGQLRPDLVCCRHTLEHIKHPLEFINTLRGSIAVGHTPAIFFELPDMSRILDEAAFWDIYYEHCGYYCAEPLRRLFLRCKFSLIEMGLAYRNQHLFLHAIPNGNAQQPVDGKKESVRTIKEMVLQFTEQLEEKISYWNDLINRSIDNGSKVVIWGSGSKCVGFLTLLDVDDRIDYIVDINPNRHNTYIPKFAKKIVAPSSLVEYRPDVVIIMNPVYDKEITLNLLEMGLTPQIYCL